MTAPRDACPPPACPLCGGRRHELIRVFDTPPPGETDFELRPYRREIRFCPECGVYYNAHGFDMSGLYSQAYNQAKYARNLEPAFDKIMALPPGESDNQGRADRLEAWAARRGQDLGELEILDVGSGLAVFAAELARRGYGCHCLDPSPLSAEHALLRAGALSARAGSIADWPPDRPLDLITWNKVLEHVVDPVELLTASRDRLKPGGAVYVELPDGEAALNQIGPERQEFYIDHVTVWTPRALDTLIRRAGLAPDESGRLRDPSGKFTLFAFATPP